MSYEKVLQAKRTIIGTKQTVKALREDQIQEIIVAEDAETRVTEQVIKQAQESGVPIHYVDSMKKLGKACGIAVGAAAVAIIR